MTINGSSTTLAGRRVGARRGTHAASCAPGPEERPRFLPFSANTCTHDDLLPLWRALVAGRGRAARAELEEPA